MLFVREGGKGQWGDQRGVTGAREGGGLRARHLIKLEYRTCRRAC